MSKLISVFQDSQKRHVRVAISQKELVDFLRYAHQDEAFFSPVCAQVSLFMDRFFHTVNNQTALNREFVAFQHPLIVHVRTSVHVMGD